MALTQIIPPGAWTYEDLFSLPDDGKRYEIIEGELYEMPSPSGAHARIIINLIALLLPIVARLRGDLFTAPYDVFVPGGNPVQPDIMVVLPGAETRVRMRGVEGPPDLVIEVISPSSRGRDLLLKRALYERAGVSEYWLVDPLSHTFEVLILSGDSFHSSQTASGDEIVISPLFERAEIPLLSVFARVDEIADE